MNTIDFENSEVISPETLADISRVIQRIEELTHILNHPVIVALDGRSGTGKSTLGTLMASKMGGIVIKSDDFWAGGADEIWSAISPQERVDRAIDWERLKKEVIEPLRDGRTAVWKTFNWERGDGLSDKPLTAEPKRVVVLDGAYSARPELKDMVDLAVLVETSNDGVRRNRLVEREGSEFMKGWHAIWDPAEDLYFGAIRPTNSFDEIIHV